MFLRKVPESSTSRSLPAPFGNSTLVVSSWKSEEATRSEYASEKQESHEIAGATQTHFGTHVVLLA